jgi:hypothetical protein
MDQHRTTFAVDIEDFGARWRTDPHRVAARAGLYRALRRSFERIGADWAACYHEDRGDGAFALVPPDVPKSVLAGRLPHEIAREVREHNDLYCHGASIRLRMALHAGEIRHDEHGVVGTALNLTFRLLDAAALKAALAESTGVLALITSEWFFEEVVRQNQGGDAYRRVPVDVKETATSGWVHLPDHSCVSGCARAT